MQIICEINCDLQKVVMIESAVKFATDFTEKSPIKGKKFDKFSTINLSKLATIPEYDYSESKW